VIRRCTTRRFIPCIERNHFGEKRRFCPVGRRSGHWTVQEDDSCREIISAVSRALRPTRVPIAAKWCGPERSRYGAVLGVASNIQNFFGHPDCSKIATTQIVNQAEVMLQQNLCGLAESLAGGQDPGHAGAGAPVLPTGSAAAAITRPNPSNAGIGLSATATRSPMIPRWRRAWQRIRWQAFCRGSIRISYGK